MKNTLVGLFVFLSVLLHAQTNFQGVWQGVMIKDGQKMEQGMLVYAEFFITKGTMEGKFRDEVYNSDLFAVKKAKGSAKGNQLQFKQIVIEKKKNAARTNWCTIEGTLSYNDSTGYLTGRYTSADCKTNTGKIILFRSKFKFSANETSPATPMWFDKFTLDFSKGYNAPEVRETERKNFRFEPIYFEYDKADILSQYTNFLDRMIRVVDGHTDLRILVTGHTDSDGSDSYNIELSKKRAEALINYFIAHGLTRDRIEIDFKGESQPVDSNETPEGKQHNRRVDFSFI